MGKGRLDQGCVNYIRPGGTDKAGWDGVGLLISQGVTFIPMEGR